MKKPPVKVPVMLLMNPVCFLAFVGGVGLLRKAPGTISSIIGVILYLTVLQHVPIRAYVLTILIGFLAGITICQYTYKKLQSHDHPAIGWDEVIGMWITLIGMRAEPTWAWAVLGFILFRIFDIYKPYPINYLDRHLKGGLGIMLDDVVAGVYACICLHIIIAVSTNFINYPITG